MMHLKIAGLAATVCLLPGVLSVAEAASLKFGPGEVSEFRSAKDEKARVVGVSGLVWSKFKKRPYRGEGMKSQSYYAFEDARLVDAEKNAVVDDADDYWCPAFTDVNLAVWAGWAAKAGYADEDEVADVFRRDPLILCDYSRDLEGTYGQYGVFDWLGAKIGVDLWSKYVGGVETDGGLAAGLVKLFAKGDRLLHLEVVFDDYVWKGTKGVGHAVTCCGYALDAKRKTSDPKALKALFIIDSDNDMYNGSGAGEAPDRITYCPVSWSSAQESYSITGVFGTKGVVFGELYSLRTKKAPKLHKTTSDTWKVSKKTYAVVFSADSSKKKTAKQTIEVGVSTKLKSNAFKKSGKVFRGWATSASNATKGKVKYSDGQKVKDLAAKGKTRTLYAVWGTPKVSVTVEVNGAKAVSGSKNKLSDASGNSVTGAGTYKSGSKVTLKAKAAAGFAFKGWYSGSTRKSTKAKYAFTTPKSSKAADVKLVAKFQATAPAISLPTWIQGEYHGYGKLASNGGEDCVFVFTIAKDGKISGQAETSGGTRPVTGQIDKTSSYNHAETEIVVGGVRASLSIWRDLWAVPGRDRYEGKGCCTFTIYTADSAVSGDGGLVSYWSSVALAAGEFSDSGISLSWDKNGKLSLMAKGQDGKPRTMSTMIYPLYVDSSTDDVAANASSFVDGSYCWVSFRYRDGKLTVKFVALDHRMLYSHL